MIDVERSQPAPASLAEGKTHRGGDVVARLSEDFFGKCYLCESDVGQASFHVDHRRPQSQFPELRFTWANLFPACEFCNGARPRKWPEGGLLDPAGGENVEQRLNQLLVGDVERFPLFSAVNADDHAARSTAEELNTIHSHTDVKGAELRRAIDMQLRRVLELVVAFLEGTAEPEKEAELRMLLSRRAPFSALVRGLVLRIAPSIAHLVA